MRLIDALYDAAQNPQGWPLALKEVSDGLGSAAATLLVIDRPTSDLRLFEGHNIPEDVVREYREHFIAVDPRLRYVRQHPERRLYFDRLHHSELEMDRDAYYDWLRRTGFRYYAAGRTIDTPETAGFFTIQRTPREGHVGEDDLEMLQLLQPHIARSSQISLMLSSCADQADAAREALHELAVGVILLDRRGRVIFKNQIAEAVLERSPLLRSDGETTLGASHRGDHYQLQNAIARALRGLDEDPGGNGAELQLASEDGEALVVRVMPLFGRDRPVLGSDAAVGIFLHDLSRVCVHDADDLAARFSLTAAEALLCQALLEGRTLNEHAARTRINRETARTHLKRVLTKTGTRRQAELVAFLMHRLPPLR